ncbi:hypothetical protein FACS1894140_1950 [Spirochaetia bacterium]|nr:hypothetical protein FACS1894140_1950 [Spirochaetia bacterium]
MKKAFISLVCTLLIGVGCTTGGKPPVTADIGVSLDEALSGIAAYYVQNLPTNTKIALINFESEARLLSDYIFEELWIKFEDGSSFSLVDRAHLGLIQKEIDYQYSGMVSDESMRSIGKQFGPQTLVYGKITRMGGEYRLVVYATDVERALTSMRSVTVSPDRRFAALLENPGAAAPTVFEPTVVSAATGSLEISTVTAGTVEITGTGMREKKPLPEWEPLSIARINAGEYRVVMLYWDGKTETQIVTIRRSETRKVEFSYQPSANPVPAVPLKRPPSLKITPSADIELH